MMDRYIIMRGVYLISFSTPLPPSRPKSKVVARFFSQYRGNLNIFYSAVNGTTPSGNFEEEIEKIVLKAFEKVFKEYFEHLTKHPSKILCWILGVAVFALVGHTEKLCWTIVMKGWIICKRGYSAPLLLPKHKSTRGRDRTKRSGSASLAAAQ
jgi:hypothetical protein